jgi:transposase-like protein
MLSSSHHHHQHEHRILGFVAGGGANHFFALEMEFVVSTRKREKHCLHVQRGKCRNIIVVFREEMENFNFFAVELYSNTNVKYTEFIHTRNKSGIPPVNVDFGK